VSSVFKHRIQAIDAAKGLAILLVVAGHLVARDIKPAGHEWYEIANRHLYTFHMGFFFFLSGLVYFLKGSPPSTFSSYRERLGRRFWQMAPAYFLLAGTVYFGKRVSQELLKVDRKVEFSMAEAFKMITQPTESYASFLWFIVALLLIEAIVPLLFFLVRGRTSLAIVVCLGLFMMPVTKFMALHQVCRYLLFFVIAAALSPHVDALIGSSKRYVVGFAGLFIGAHLLLPSAALPITAGLLAIPTLLGVVAATAPGVQTSLATLGTYTFVIYLFNTICIGLTKGVMLKFVSWNGAAFFVFLPILMLAGSLGPLLIKRYVFRRIPFLDRITG
jgi:fucose 4-O-acetylase-like acetyltransferase